LANVHLDLANAEQSELVRAATPSRTSTISISPHMKRLRACWRSSTLRRRSAPSLSSAQASRRTRLLYRKLRAGPAAMVGSRPTGPAC